MSIHSLKHRIHKRANLRNRKQDYSDIGSFIKKRRMELNVTQDELSSGTCSHSYLSKLENNQIVPNEYYVRELLDKLEVDKSVFETSLKDKHYVNRMILAYFQMDDKAITAIYDEIQSIEHNTIINLCKLGYIVFFNREDENQYVMMLEHLINNMTDLEVRLYLYFAAVYFSKQAKFKTALELIVLQESLPQQNEYLAAMFHDLAYAVKQRLGVKNSAAENYQHAMNLYNKYHNVTRVIRLALQKITWIVEEHPTRALAMLDMVRIDLLDDRNRDQHHLLKASALFAQERYNEATLALKAIPSTSHLYLRKMTLLLQICVIEDDHDMIDRIRSKLKEYKADKTQMNDKIHYHYLIQTDPQGRKEYLRDIAIPFAINVEDYRRLEEYTNEMMRLCADSSRYKEAIQHYHKFRKEVQKIRRILH